MDSHEFLKSLTIVLAVAAVMTVLFQRFRQPVVLGYIIAGLIVGPHVPIPLIARPQAAACKNLTEQLRQFLTQPGGYGTGPSPNVG